MTTYNIVYTHTAAYWYFLYIPILQATAQYEHLLILLKLQ